MKTTSFDELRTVRRKSVIELKSIYGLDPLRDIWDGDVTSDGSEFKLTAAAGGAKTALLSTAERGPYPPGQVLEPGQAARPEGKPTGGQGARWGYYDALDGWFYLLNAQGFFTVVRRNGVDAITQFGTWKGDQITQSGFARKFAFRPADGYIYQNPFSWYGFGPADYEFQLKQQPANQGWLKKLFTATTEGQTSVTQPHLFLRAEAFNDVGDDPYTLYISGRQVSVVGDYNPIFRKTSVEARRTDITDAAWFPMMAVRRAAVYPYALSQLLRLDPVLAGSMRLAVVENAPVTEQFGPIPDYKEGLTLLERNLTPSDPVEDLATVGNYLEKILVSGTGKNTESGDPRPLVRMPMIETRPFTIYARRETGNATTAELSLTAVFREDR